MEYKVSVIIPVYNVEAYLRECLDSVIGQTLDDIEIICINDASTDNSLAILKEYKDVDNRIRIINNPENQGLSCARNNGMKSASGKYIYFLDSDDYIALNAMEELYHIAEEDKLDVIFFDSKLVLDIEELRHEMVRDDLFMTKAVYPNIITGKEFLAEMRKNNELREPVWIQFWNRSVLQQKEIAFYPGIVHEDLLFTFKGLMNASRLLCINQCYHFYRKRENAITTISGHEKHIVGLLITYREVFREWQDKWQQLGIDEPIENYLDRISWKINHYLAEKDISEEINWILRNSPIEKHLFKLIKEKQVTIINGPKKYIDWQKFDAGMLESWKEIIIYGAGSVGKEAAEYIGRTKKITAFAVSETDGNEKYIYGYPITCIDELKEKKDALFIVAVTKKYQEAIINKLKQLQLKNYRCLPSGKL